MASNDLQQQAYGQMYRAGSQQSPFTQTPAANYAMMGALGSQNSPAPQQQQQQQAPSQGGQPPHASYANPKDYFMQLTQGMPASSDNLLKLEPQLTAAGYKVLRNARGQAGKVIAPNGQAIDVGYAFGTNDPNQMHWQWLENGPAGGQAPHANPWGSLLGHAMQMQPGSAPTAPLQGPGQQDPMQAQSDPFSSGPLRQNIMNQLALSRALQF